MKYNAQRAAGTPLTEEQRGELRRLAAMPDEHIDFKDIPERLYPLEAAELPLEQHTMTLHVDAEVAEFISKLEAEHTSRLNSLLKRVARREAQRSSHSMELDKAS